MFYYTQKISKYAFHTCALKHLYHIYMYMYHRIRHRSCNDFFFFSSVQSFYVYSFRIMEFHPSFTKDVNMNNLLYNKKKWIRNRFFTTQNHWEALITCTLNVLVLIWAEQHFTSQLRIILYDAVHSENELKLSFS